MTRALFLSRWPFIWPSQRGIKSYAALVLLLVTLPMIGGCAVRLVDARGKRISNQEYLCPGLSVVKGAEAFESYRSGSERPEDLVLSAKFGTVSGICNVFINYVEMEVDFDIEAFRGPAAQSLTNYEVITFVTIVDVDENILVSRRVPVELSFRFLTEPNLVHRETVALDIPLQPRESASDYAVFVGFVLNNPKDGRSR